MQEESACDGHTCSGDPRSGVTKSHPTPPNPTVSPSHKDCLWKNTKRSIPGRLRSLIIGTTALRSDLSDNAQEMGPQ